MKKFNANNIEKITSAIAAAEKGCSARKMDPEFVCAAIKRAEAALSGLLFKKDWKGIQVRIDAAGGQSFPNSYSGVPESTQVDIEFSGSAWFVTSIRRSRVNSKAVELLNLNSKKDELVRFALERKTAA